jgi:hypothetical protein
MKVSVIVATAAWLSVLGALWAVFLGHPLDWTFGVLVAACVIIGTVAGTLATRYVSTAAPGGPRYTATPQPKGPPAP